jgi:hypothetical protein
MTKNKPKILSQQRSASHRDVWGQMEPGEDHGSGTVMAKLYLWVRGSSFVGRVSKERRCSRRGLQVDVKGVRPKQCHLGHSGVEARARSPYIPQDEACPLTAAVTLSTSRPPSSRVEGLPEISKWTSSLVLPAADKWTT